MFEEKQSKRNEDINQGDSLTGISLKSIWEETQCPEEELKAVKVLNKEDLSFTLRGIKRNWNRDFAGQLYYCSPVLNLSSIKHLIMDTQTMEKVYITGSMKIGEILAQLELVRKESPFLFIRFEQLVALCEDKEGIEHYWKCSKESIVHKGKPLTSRARRDNYFKAFKTAPFPLITGQFAAAHLSALATVPSDEMLNERRRDPCLAASYRVNLEITIAREQKANSRAGTEGREVVEQDSISFNFL